MQNKQQSTFFILLFVMLTLLINGCSGKQLLRTETRQDAKTEEVVQNDPLAHLRSVPAKEQRQVKDDVQVDIKYLRIMDEKDFTCLKRLSHDPLNPKLLFAFRMLNTSDRVRMYTPIFVFKGEKDIDLSEKDPCSFFQTYGKVNVIQAKPGNRFSLQCGEGQSDGAVGVVESNATETVTLYPEVPVYGILIVGTEGPNQALELGTPHLSQVKGHAAFFETTMAGMKPVNFRFNYMFERKDWLEEMLYSKTTPFTYNVDIYEKYTNLPLLGKVSNGEEENRVSGSEKYFPSTLKLIGPVKK